MVIRKIDYSGEGKVILAGGGVGGGGGEGGGESLFPKCLNCPRTNASAFPKVVPTSFFCRCFEYQFQSFTQKMVYQELLTFM